MLYFKHTELAKTYHVSLRTVHNWVEATKKGKLDLSLHQENGKAYVANTAGNMLILTELTASRRKYRNTKATKIVTPKPDFYTIYSEEQVYDIISNLEIHHEIPHQYNYFEGGADRWQKYIERLAAEDAPNSLTCTLKLLNVNESYIDDLLSDYRRVNIIDIGAGNAYPAKTLLAHLLEQDKLGRYVALDISPSMLEVAKDNVKSWFGDRVAYEGYEYDINYDRFSKLLANEYMKDDSSNTVNLVLLFGGTLSNMRYPDNGYKMIHDSMGINDLLIHANKLDTEVARQYFDFNLKPGETKLAAVHRLAVDLLNIDESFYDIEMGYDSSINQRFVRVRLRVAVTIQFVSKAGKREVSLNKGDAILLWRGIQHTVASIIAQFNRNDFYPLHTSQTDNQDYILTISKVKRD